MKQFTLSIGTLLIMFIGLSNPINAQTTILERDGAQNEFVPGDWSVQGGGFANTDKVNITSGGSGTLILSNSDAYTDITVEVHFSQTGTISYDLRLFAGGNEAASELGNISDNTGAVNTSIVSFNNTSAIALNALDFSNTNINIGITYIKITGTLDPTSNLLTENQNSFQIGAVNKTVFIESELDGSVEIYNSNGRKEFSSKINQGQSKLSLDNLEGLYFVVLRNKAGEILRRQKVILI